MARTHASRQFYASLTPRSRAMLDAAIFCLFAPLGFAIDIAALGTNAVTSVVAFSLLSGAVAVRHGCCGVLRRRRLCPTPSMRQA